MKINGSREHHPGFSIVEMLVVVAVIGILAGLLLPAIQMTRESARRTRCSNKLRQLGLGVHGYRELHGGSFGDRWVHFFDEAEDTDRWDYWSWSVPILPFIEQDALHDAIDESVRPMDTDRNLLATPLSAFRCPSESGSESERFREMGTFESVTVPLQNYGLNIFSGTESLSQVTDGLSRTLMLGETVVSMVDLPEGRGHFASTWCCMLAGFKRFENAYFVFPWVFYQFGVVPPREALFNAASSHHPGGASSVMFDGSVHFLSSDIDRDVVGALAVGNDGLPLSNEWMQD